MTQTRAEPKLSLRQHAALIAVQALLESGKMVHRRDGDQEYAPHGACFFNMNYWKDEQEIYDENDMPIHCGTMMCIGGTMDWLLGEKTYEGETKLGDLTDSDSGLYELFYPGNGPMHGDGGSSVSRRIYGRWDSITPSEAAKAIANYRQHGDPKWAEVLGLNDE